MDFLELWFLKRLLRKQARQHAHGDAGSFSRLYALIREAYQNEFTEDNTPTTDANLREWFESTQKRHAALKAS